MSKKTFVKKLSALILIAAFAVTTLSGCLPEAYLYYEYSPDNQASHEDAKAYEVTVSSDDVAEYTFANEERLKEHFEKHGKEMGFTDPLEYQKAASAVVTNPDSLHKTEAEDGDDVYFLESTGELVIVSTWGFIRTYFVPNDGIEYFNRT